MVATVAAPTIDKKTLRRLESESGVEFVDGQIVEKPMSMQGSRAATRVTARLVIQGDRTGGWDVYDSSLGYKIFPNDPDHFRKPDVSVILRDRADAGRTGGFCFAPPDLAVEVVSTHDEAEDVETKVEEYLTHGVKMVWVVFTLTRTVYVHRAGGGVLRLHAADTIDGADVLAGFSCKVGDFFDA